MKILIYNSNLKS